MTKTYTPTSITYVPGAPASYSFCYVRAVDVGGGEIIRSPGHHGGFTDTPEGRAAEYAIAADGTKKTGTEILADFGMS